MKKITDGRVELYKLAYEESLEKTDDGLLSWKHRKQKADRYAREVSPNVADACSAVMKWRHASLSPPGMTEREVTTINKLLRWKTEITKRNDDKPYARGRAAKISTDENPVVEANGPSVSISYGYITTWYEQWFKEHDRLFARDKELASILDCSTGAFSSARRTLKEMGYEFVCDNGTTKILQRPVDTSRQKEIDQINDELASLSRAIEQAKNKLDTLLI